VPNASGTPPASNPTTSSDDAHDKSAGSSKRKRFRTKDEKNVALNKLSQLRYRRGTAALISRAVAAVAEGPVSHPQG
jgi:hypothetical protein